MKADDPKGSGGSNPSSSAVQQHNFGKLPERFIGTASKTVDPKKVRRFESFIFRWVFHLTKDKVDRKSRSCQNSGSKCTHRWTAYHFGVLVKEVSSCMGRCPLTFNGVLVQQARKLKIKAEELDWYKNSSRRSNRSK